MYWKALLALLGMVFSELTLILLNLFTGVPGYPMLFAITAFFLVISSGILVIAYLRVMSGAWEQFIDRTRVSEERVSIPVADGWSLAALVMKPREDAGTPRPAVICHHGLSGNGEKMIDIAIPLALRGYTVILPDARGHGKSKKL
nr:alpha/beta fold hydrolase [Candidatus Sigynarchaeota archaeon]